MKFCIAEALRMQDRAAIEYAECIVIHADSRKHRMTVRYSSCNSDLVVKKGYFGHVDCVAEHTDSVEHYLQSVLKVLKNFCTEALGVPATQSELVKLLTLRVSPPAHPVIRDAVEHADEERVWEAVVFSKGGWWRRGNRRRRGGRG